MFACTCWTTTANRCLQCIVYFRSTVLHFPYTKLCKSITVVPMVL
uniref:Macaca fascicularis brain cDNA, clone: QflA-20486 n=1 Tax=Macaca fascicularis TaxID=9541 RepID=I7GIJ9_MACFA|nr:unnamed protein product [Macaca fascicularis]